MAISKRRITAAEFDALLPWLSASMSDDRINAARATMVDGLSQRVAAAPYGWTRQAVNDAVTAVWSKLQQYRTAQSKTENVGVLLPPGWEQVTLIAPTVLINKFRSEIAAHAVGLTGECEEKVSKPKRVATSRVR